MITTKPFAAAALALVLASGMAFAAPGQSHDSHGATALEMRLDQGRKWQTDEVLRTGMTKIRTALVESVPRIHEGRFTAAEFSALADRVQDQVDNVVSNCKLPEEADLQLHIALTQLLEGVSAMKSGAGQELGAAAIVQALNAYGDHFDHPGWEAVGH
jgi:hypothetical protein